jgi:hypothetical protein
LQLDPEAIPAEGGEQAAAALPGATRFAALPGAGEGSLARAPGEAHEALGVTLHLLKRDLRRPRLPPRVVAGAAVRLRDQPAEVAVAGRILDQEGEVEVLDGELRSDDRSDVEVLAGMRELHRAPQPVVVGERESGISELGRRGRELEWGRGPIQERERGMTVQLDVGRGRSAAGPFTRATRGRGVPTPSWEGGFRDQRWRGELHQERCRNQSDPARNTTRSRPSASTSSK